jgi:hypothetical protein
MAADLMDTECHGRDKPGHDEGDKRRLRWFKFRAGFHHLGSCG